MPHKQVQSTALRNKTKRPASARQSVSQQVQCTWHVYRQAHTHTRTLATHQPPLFATLPTSYS